MPKRASGPTVPPTDVPASAEARSSAAIDPRNVTFADRHLQEEISNALEELADSLPELADLRLARSLSAILEPSWSEHVDFQEAALFPIIIRHKGGLEEAVSLLGRLSTEHTELADRHTEVSEYIEMLVAGELTNYDTFGYLLRSAFEARRHHAVAESCIEDMLPRLLTPADRTMLTDWRKERSTPPFPINLILDRRH
jgi:hypothetical protein